MRRNLFVLLCTANDQNPHSMRENRWALNHGRSLLGLQLHPRMRRRVGGEIEEEKILARSRKDAGRKGFAAEILKFLSSSAALRANRLP